MCLYAEPHGQLLMSSCGAERKPAQDAKLLTDYLAVKRVTAKTEWRGSPGSSVALELSVFQALK